MILDTEKAEIKRLYFHFTCLVPRLRSALILIPIKLGGICVTCGHNDLQLCFHLEQNPLISMTADIIINRLFCAQY